MKRSRAEERWARRPTDVEGALQVAVDRSEGWGSRTVARKGQAEPGEQAIRALEWRAEVDRALRSARRRLWAQA
ncbi:MAG: hypothetical protein ABSC51_04845 [Gaiellaceae bacterium]